MNDAEIPRWRYDKHTRIEDGLVWLVLTHPYYPMHRFVIGNAY